jgi:hypothetical protein
MKRETINNLIRITDGHTLEAFTYALSLPINQWNIQLTHNGIRLDKYMKIIV